MSEHITVNLFGKDYKFAADQDVVDARAVADLLVSEVSSVKSRVVESSRQNDFAMLTQAALNIADGFVKLQAKHSNLLNNISSRSESLKQMIEASL